MAGFFKVRFVEFCFSELLLYGPENLCSREPFGKPELLTKSLSHARWCVLVTDALSNRAQRCVPTGSLRKASEVKFQGSLSSLVLLVSFVFVCLFLGWMFSLCSLGVWL